MNKPARWVIGNWKMNGSLAGNASLLEALTARISSAPESPNVAVCAPYPYLNQLQRTLGGTAFQYGAQDVSEHVAGAYTGQVSAAMLLEFGARLALVGHSERRLYNGEASETVAKKAEAAITAGLIAVICVGETLEQREANAAESTVADQLAACESAIRTGSEHPVKRVVIAYEPVWAIGTGKTATPAEAQAMHAYIRARLAAISAAAAHISILYGGSVKASNAGELFSQPDINGGLIGGASLVTDEFLAIVAAA